MSALCSSLYLSPPFPPRWASSLPPALPSAGATREAPQWWRAWQECGPDWTSSGPLRPRAESPLQACAGLSCPARPLAVQGSLSSLGSQGWRAPGRTRSPRSGQSCLSTWRHFSRKVGSDSGSRVCVSCGLKAGLSQGTFGAECVQRPRWPLTESRHMSGWQEGG